MKKYYDSLEYEVQEFELEMVLTTLSKNPTLDNGDDIIDESGDDNGFGF